VSSDASPRTEEPAAEEAEPETPATPQPADPAEPQPAAQAKPAAHAKPAAQAEAPAEPEAAAQPGEPKPGSTAEADPEADPAGEHAAEHAVAEHPAGEQPAADHPEEPVGRFAGALDWAYDNRLIRVGLFAAIVIGVLAVWSSHDSVSDSRNSTIQDAAVSARPPDEADIAAVARAAGCTPRQTVRNATYTQAACITPSSHLTITTFASDKGQQEWLDEAIPYGGAYLIGKRWVVGANDPTGMNKIATSLGGTIVDHSKDHD
jgi:hypothetical protein